MAEMIIGRMQSELLALIYAHLTKERREMEVQNALAYQHKADDVDEVTFMAVYDPRIVCHEAALYSVTSNCAFPEDHILWSIDKVVIYKDDRGLLNSPTSYERARVQAFAILRFNGDNPYTRRVKITLTYSQNETGRRWMHKREICDVNFNAEDPDFIKAVLAAEEEPVIS